MSAPALLAVAAASLALATPLIAASAALEAEARAAGAADAAALAAADAALGWADGDPCLLAGEVTSAVGVALSGCEVDSASGQVRVSASVQTIFGTVSVHAHAGPPVA